MTTAEFLAALAPIHPLLWHHAQRLARGRRGVEAEDLYQVAAMVLWQVRAKADGHANPGGWFAQAGRWAMLRHLERMRAVTPCDPETLAATIATTDPEPDEWDTLLAFAPDRYHELLTRRFHDGETFEQIADTLGVTGPAVRQRMEVALDQLRGRLAG